MAYLAVDITRLSNGGFYSLRQPAAGAEKRLENGG
jgi:hypothetical protein